MPEDAEGSQASQAALNPTAFQQELRILRSFTVLRRVALARSAASAVQDDSEGASRRPLHSLPRHRAIQLRALAHVPLMQPLEHARDAVMPRRVLRAVDDHDMTR